MHDELLAGVAAAEQRRDDVAEGIAKSPSGQVERDQDGEDDQADARGDQAARTGTSQDAAPEAERVALEDALIRSAPSGCGGRGR